MAAAGAILLLPSCGGGDSGRASVSDSNSGSGNASTSASGNASTSSSTSGSGNNNGSTSAVPPPPPRPMLGSVSDSWSIYRCSPLPQTTTIVGGTLFVAEQGPVGVTLLSDGGLSQ